MKKAFLFLLSLIVVTASYAADTKPIEDEFQKYWGFYAKKEFAKAAGETLPADLEAMKAAVLPVFLANQNPKSKDGQAIVAAFFDKTVGKARDGMSAAEVVAGLNRVIAAGSPGMFETFKDASLTVVFVRTPAPDTAEVHFQVMLRGASDMDMEQLVKKDGRWWIRLKDDPKDTAETFKELLTRQQ